MKITALMLGTVMVLVAAMATASTPQYDDEQADPPAGYKCTAGKKVWVQLKPCPSTYAHWDSVDVDGTTDSGTPFHGGGSVRRDLPVLQEDLTRDQLCELVDEGFSMGHKNIADDGYARNMTGCNG